MTLQCPYCPWQTMLMGDAADEAFNEHVKGEHIEEVPDEEGAGEEE